MSAINQSGYEDHLLGALLIYSRLPTECEEYSKLAVNKFSVSPLVLEPEIYEFETPNCDFTTPLIVDGEKAKTGEFPHMAAVGWRTDGRLGTYMLWDFQTQLRSCSWVRERSPLIDENNNDSS